MHLLLLLLYPLFASALILEEEVRQELQRIGFPARQEISSDILDVAIIGGGQSGLGLCFGLQKEGVFNVAIFDKAPEGFEGPWLTTARMKQLRSGKEAPGPSLNIPCLTFRAWYEAQWDDWEILGNVPTHLWANYLQWYRKVLDLPVHNGFLLEKIEPQGEDLFLLRFKEREVVFCRKVVLATGYSGCGGFSTPVYLKKLPKEAWFHTGEEIDPKLFYGKRVCILGAAASAFDAAATALENGALKVDMLMRRAFPAEGLPFSKCRRWDKYGFWSDEKRIAFFEGAWESGVVVPCASIDRVEIWPNFTLLKDVYVENAFHDKEISLQTNIGVLFADILIAATGYEVDILAVPEIQNFADKILLWSDKGLACSERAGRFPYVGCAFEFLEKHPGQAPFLKNIHCFNYGAFLSQGKICGEIDVLPIGIERLARHISQDLTKSLPKP